MTEPYDQTGHSRLAVAAAVATIVMQAYAELKATGSSSPDSSPRHATPSYGNQANAPQHAEHLPRFGHRTLPGAYIEPAPSERLAAARERLLEGLATLVGADSWSWSAPNEAPMQHTANHTANHTRATPGAPFSDIAQCGAATFARRRGHFTPADRSLASSVVVGARQLNEPAPPHDTPALTSRQRDALTHLREARGRKEVAEQMGLAEMTARDHIRAVYDHYGVEDHLDLMRRFMFDGDRTTPAAVPSSTAMPT